MSVVTKKSNLALAAAAAALFTLAPVVSHAGEDVVKCMGVNSCKGLSSCKTASSSCKGLNSCKGHGFVAVSSDACKQLGGTEG